MMAAEQSEWEALAHRDAFDWCHPYSIIDAAFQGC